MDTSEYCNQSTYPLESCEDNILPVQAQQQGVIRKLNGGEATSSSKPNKQKKIDEYEIPNSYVHVSYDDLQFYECCGCGTFGSVYRAVWLSQGKQEVAVKKINHMDNEAHVLSLLSHRNIVQFYGACAEAPNFCIITEYAPYGSLFDFLSTTESEKLEFSQLLSWARDIALGMNYLHEEAPVTVIHRDLKSKNVVICKDFTLKICDFGASRFFDETVVMTTTGTYPWMAPELIQGLPTSELCDVYSFGVVLWELLTRQVPFKGLQGFQIAWVVVENEERPLIPTSCPQRFSELMKLCWSSTVEKRPAFYEIITELNVMLNDDHLGEATNQFLNNKEEWVREMKEKVDDLRCQEKEMHKKEEELNRRERKLKEWERKMKEEMKKQTLIGVARYSQKSENLNCKISVTGEGAIDSVKDVLSHIMSKGGMNSNGQQASSSRFEGDSLSSSSPSFPNSTFSQKAWPIPKQDSLSNLAGSSPFTSDEGFGFPHRGTSRRLSSPACYPLTAVRSPGFSRSQSPRAGPIIDSDINFSKSDTSKQLELFAKPRGFSSTFTDAGGADTGTSPNSEDASWSQRGFNGVPRHKIQKQVSTSSEEYNFEGSKVSRSTAGSDRVGNGKPEVQTWESAKGEAKVNRNNEKFELDTNVDLKPAASRPPPPSLRKLKSHNSSPCLLQPFAGFGTRGLEKNSLIPDNSLQSSMVKDPHCRLPSEQTIQVALESLVRAGQANLDDKFAERLLRALENTSGSQSTRRSIEQRSSGLHAKGQMPPKLSPLLNSGFESRRPRDLVEHGSPATNRVGNVTESIDEFSARQVKNNQESRIEECQQILGGKSNASWDQSADAVVMKTGSERRSAIEESVNQRRSSRSSNSTSFVSSTSPVEICSKTPTGTTFAPSPSSRRRLLPEAKSNLLVSAKEKWNGTKTTTADWGGMTRPETHDKASQVRYKVDADARKTNLCSNCADKTQSKADRKRSKHAAVQTSDSLLSPITTTYVDAVTQTPGQCSAVLLTDNHAGKTEASKAQPHRKAKKYAGKTKRCEIAKPKEHFLVTGDFSTFTDQSGIPDEDLSVSRGCSKSLVTPDIEQEKQDDFHSTVRKPGKQMTTLNNAYDQYCNDTPAKVEAASDHRNASTLDTTPASEQGYYKGGFLRNRRSLLPSYYRRYFSDSGLEGRSRYENSNLGIQIPTVVNGVMRSKSEEPRPRLGQALLRRSVSSSPNPSTDQKFGFIDDGASPIARKCTPSPLGRGKLYLNLDEQKPLLPEDDQNEVTFQRSSITSPASSYFAPPLSIDSGCCDDGRTSGCSSPCSSAHIFAARDSKPPDSNLMSPQDVKSDLDDWNQAYLNSARRTPVQTIHEPARYSPGWREGRIVHDKNLYDVHSSRNNSRRGSLQNENINAPAKPFTSASNFPCKSRSPTPLLNDAERTVRAQPTCRDVCPPRSGSPSDSNASRSISGTKHLGAKVANIDPSVTSVDPPSYRSLISAAGKPTKQNGGCRAAGIDKHQRISKTEAPDTDLSGRSSSQSSLRPAYDPKQIELLRGRFVAGAQELLNNRNCRSSDHLVEAAGSNSPQPPIESPKRTGLPCRYSTQLYLSGLGEARNSPPRQGFSPEVEPRGMSPSTGKVPLIRRLDTPQSRSDIFETDDYTYIIRPRGRRVH